MWLSDTVLGHLCKVVGEPDLSGTRYELVEKIGQGGMGTVYLARDRELDRPVALKVLHVLPRETQAEARLVQEARIIARLEHPGIVPVHDCGVLPDGRFYYAMKMVRGQRLDDPAACPAGLAERLRIFQKICDAVAFAHAHGIIHRDLKPQNIMLGPFGEVLVMDWGVAKEAACPQPQPLRPSDNGNAGNRAQTLHGTVLGTPGYMAPEQARGDLDVDARCDVYALGGILYFLLTRRAPGPTPPRRYDRSIPRSLQAICMKTLAADRGARYAGVPELAEDVADFLAGRRVRAYPEGLWEAGRRLGTKYRAAVALILAYLVMRILLLIFAGA
jgi:serine/threonine protein kinase